MKEQRLQHDMRRQRREPRIDVSHCLAQPGRMITGLVDLVGHGWSDDAAVTARRLFAKVARFDRVEPEGRNMAMRLAKTQRQ